MVALALSGRSGRSLLACGLLTGEDTPEPPRDWNRRAKPGSDCPKDLTYSRTSRGPHAPLMNLDRRTLLAKPRIQASLRRGRCGWTSDPLSVGPFSLVKTCELRHFFRLLICEFSLRRVEEHPSKGIATCQALADVSRNVVRATHGRA